MIKNFIIYIIKLYQRFISPLFGRRCRFYPTCSQYSLEAVTRFGILKGSYLSLKRILKCNPFNKGGYDPVPDKQLKKGDKNEKKI